MARLPETKKLRASRPDRWFSQGLRLCILLIFFFALPLVLTSCGQTGLPTGPALKETFPERFIALLSPTNPSAHGEFSVSDINIIRQETNGETILASCLIELSNENYTVRSEADLTYSYHDPGGWTLDDWEIKGRTLRPLHGIPDGEIAKKEEYLRERYPDARYASRETDIEQTLSDTLYYEIPSSVTRVGNTGIEIVEGGMAELKCSWSDDMMQWCGDVWKVERQWENYQGDWYNASETGSDAGRIDSITIHDISYRNYYSDVMGCVIKSQTYGSKITRQVNVELRKCSAGTAVWGIAPSSYGDCQNSICYFEGSFNYPKYNDDPNGAQYEGLVLFTKDGLVIYGKGESQILDNGAWATDYHSSCIFEKQ